MKKISIVLSVLFVICCVSTNAQNIKYAHKVLDTLCSKTMFGRSVSKGGNKAAAEFITAEFKNFGLQKFGESYQQKFLMTCNDIEDVEMAVCHPDSILKAGDDYVVFGTSPTTEIKKENVKPLYFNTLKAWTNFKKEKLQGKVLVFDAQIFPYDSVRNILRQLEASKILPELIVSQNIGKKLTFPGGRRLSPIPVVLLRNQLFKTKEIPYLYFKTQSRFYDNNYETQNIVGYVEGKKCADSFFVFTSHYDHLGGLGKEAYYPGANDNASSVAVLLDLASYYAKPENKPDYSILFIATTGEELGLLGAEYFASHPLLELSKIKFLINMDMVGTGSGGFHLVHGSFEPRASDLMEKINAENYYFTQIVRGEGVANNSDHYPFYKRGVHCLFVFTSGCEYNEYHTIYDKTPELPFTKYQSVFSILRDFVQHF